MSDQTKQRQRKQPTPKFAAYVYRLRYFQMRLGNPDTSQIAPEEVRACLEAAERVDTELLHMGWSEYDSSEPPAPSVDHSALNAVTSFVRAFKQAEHNLFRLGALSASEFKSAYDSGMKFLAAYEADQSASDDSEGA